MSSQYGPDLLKPPEVDDNVDEAIGRKKAKDGLEFETDHDRAKRIRRERRQQKVKDNEENKKHQMSLAINSLLSTGSASTSTCLNAAAHAFASFGPSVGPPAGPTLEPAASPAGPHGPPEVFVGPAGPPVGPAGFPAKSVGPPRGPVAASAAGSGGPLSSQGDVTDNDGSGEARAGSVGPAPRPRGPRRPSQEEMPSKPAPAGREEDKPVPPPVKLGVGDYLAQQKRVSWDELKRNLAEANWREEGVPGSRQFDDYSAKLEKNRNERLKQQEDDTKRLLKHMNKGKHHTKEKKKDKHPKGAKRTADGAILAASDNDSSDDQEDALMSRYKQKV